MEDLLAVGLDGEATHFDELFRRTIGIMCGQAKLISR